MKNAALCARTNSATNALLAWPTQNCETRRTNARQTSIAFGHANHACTTAPTKRSKQRSTSAKRSAALLDRACLSSKHKNQLHTRRDAKSRKTMTKPPIMRDNTKNGDDPFFKQILLFRWFIIINYIFISFYFFTNCTQDATSNRGKQWQNHLSCVTIQRMVTTMRFIHSLNKSFYFGGS